MNTRKKIVYLDHAAGTPCDARVWRAMTRAKEMFGNPSSPHTPGRQAEALLAASRAQVAEFLHARPEEIIFTASGSEANNMAVVCSIRCAPAHTRGIVTTPIEHVSILDPIQAGEDTGSRIAYIRVNRAGTIDLAHAKRLLTPRTLLVSVMYASNEIGTIEPIAALGKIIKAFRRRHGSPYPLFHTDACQATEYLSMDVQRLGVDLLTFNGSKIYGPRGVGVLFVRRGTPVGQWIRGGRQEMGIRAGTENVPAIAGLARALDLINSAHGTRTALLRDYFITQIRREVPEAVLNGAMGEDRLPNNVHIAIPGLTSENLLLELDARGVAAGKGSACTAYAVEPSHVMSAIGLDPVYADGALRFSLGRGTTRKEIDRATRALKDAVKNLRRRYAGVHGNTN